MLGLGQRDTGRLRSGHTAVRTQWVRAAAGRFLANLGRSIWICGERSGEFVQPSCHLVSVARSHSLSPFLSPHPLVICACYQPMTNAYMCWQKTCRKLMRRAALYLSIAVAGRGRRYMLQLRSCPGVVRRNSASLMTDLEN